MYSQEILGYLTKTLKFEKKFRHYEKIYYIGQKQFKVIATVKDDNIDFYIKKLDIYSSDDIKKLDCLWTRLKKEFRELSEFQLTETKYGNQTY